MKIPQLILALFITHAAASQPFALVRLDSIGDVSFRGMSVVDDRVVWASGNKGTVVKSTDGGKTWTRLHVMGFDILDFRSLYAFNAQEAIIANAGSPAYVLRTSDGGAHWSVVYTSNHPDAFFDGVDFWNDRDGILYGDPIDGRMSMLRTQDGGKNWSTVTSAPQLEKGEASFAASGTGIRCYGKSSLLICTGGTVSRLWASEDMGQTWTAIQPPVAQGKASTGIFSVVRWSGKRMMVVGGDFADPGMSTGHQLLSRDGGAHWILPRKPVKGYRECVEVIRDKALIAVGPGGTDISVDGGMVWTPVTAPAGLHVARKARKGKVVFAAGNQGALYVLTQR